MRKLLRLKAMLLLCALIAGSGSLWAEEKTAEFDFDTNSVTTFGITGESSSSSTDGDITSNVSATINDVTVTITPSGGSTANRFWSTSPKLRMYGGTMTISAGTNIIKSIAFNTGSGKFSVTASTGTVSGSKTSWSWAAPSSGTVSSIDFTINSNTQIKDFTVTYETVSTSPLASISVDASGATTVFHQNDAFSSDGIVVTATYEDESSKAVTGYTVTAPDMTTIGQKSVNVSYTEGSVTKESTYNIEVKALATLTSITLSGTYTTVFAYAASFSYEGMVVTAHYDDETSKVVDGYTVSTPDMTPAGEKVVTVTYTEREVTQTATYTITVNEYTQPTSITINDWATLFGVSASAGSLSGDALKDYDGEIDNVVVSYMKGSGSNMYIKTADLRIYNGNKLVFTAPEGYGITKIEFTGTSASEKAPIANFGTFDYSKKVWEGNANIVTLFRTSGSAYTKFESAVITLAAAPVTLTKTVTSAGWATYAPEYSVSFGDDEAYIVTNPSTTATTLVEVSSVPAGTPVLLKGAGDHTLTVVGTSSTNVNDNCLKVSDGTAKNGIYVLANGDFGVGFYLWTGENALSAGKIYMQIPSASREFFSLYGEANSIDTLLTNNEEVKGKVYNLSGQRVAQPSKGFYIVNGKKVIIK